VRHSTRHRILRIEELKCRKVSTTMKSFRSMQYVIPTCKEYNQHRDEPIEALLIEQKRVGSVRQGATHGKDKRRKKKYIFISMIKRSKTNCRPAQCRTWKSTRCESESQGIPTRQASNHDRHETKVEKQYQFDGMKKETINGKDRVEHVQIDVSINARLGKKLLNLLQPPHHFSLYSISACVP
jgi:hypothetical protein